MTQKNYPYIKLFKVFITLSRVRLVSCILSLLNILCNSLVNHITLKMLIHLLFMLQPIHAFSDVLDFTEVE